MQFQNNTKGAIGNYAALASTHYNIDGTGQASDNGTPGTLYPSNGSLIGNGIIAFPSVRAFTNGANSNPKGVTHAGIRDGTSLHDICSARPATRNSVPGLAATPCMWWA